MTTKITKSSKDLTQPTIEVSHLGQPFTVGSHVSFTFGKEHFDGIVEKQLKSSAIITFTGEGARSTLAQDLKQKIVISYRQMALV